MKKLTLSMDEDVIQEAKHLAAEQETSVSAMFSRLVRAMASGPVRDDKKGPITREATGLVDLPSGKSDREMVQNALEHRYGPKR